MDDCSCYLKQYSKHWVFETLWCIYIHVYICCLCILPPGPGDQRTKISSECQEAVWKGLVDTAMLMPLHPFGTLYLHLLNVPLPLILSRAAWRLIYSMWRIPRSTESYIVRVYCLWLIFSCDQAALWMVFSVRLSVRLSHLFDYVPIIVSSWNFQELSHWTRVRSMQKVKVRGQRSRSQRSRPKFSFPDCNSSLNSHMMMKWYI